MAVRTRFLSPTFNTDLNPTPDTEASGNNGAFDIVSAGGTPDVPPTAQPIPPAQIAQPQQPTHANSFDTIAGAYQQYLGRAMSPDEYNFWADRGDYAQGIQGSAEGQAYAQRTAQQPPSAPAPAAGATQLSLRQPQITAMSQQNAPIGFDATKWADPTHQTDKYVAGKLLQAGNTLQDVVAALNANGNSNYTIMGTDKVVDQNDGNIYDVMFDEDNQTGQRHPQWTLVGNIHGNAAGAQGGGGTDIGAGSGMTGGQPIPAWMRTMFGGGAGGNGGMGGGGGVGANLPGGFTEAGADPMSGLIDSGLAGLIMNGGGTPLSDSVASQLMRVIQGGGVGPDTTNQLIGAREAAALAQQGMLADARAALAGNGSLSVPGVEQGSTNAAIRKISETIAPDFASAVRDIYSQALDESNQSFMQALSLATGMSDDQAKNMLAALGSGTNRQQAMAGLALQQLSQNMDWNKFLAQHSLDTAKVAEDIQNGRMDRVIQLLQLFLQGAGNTQQGYY